MPRALIRRSPLGRRITRRSPDHSTRKIQAKPQIGLPGPIRASNDGKTPTHIQPRTIPERQEPLSLNPLQQHPGPLSKIAARYSGQRINLATTPYPGMSPR
jgi:hypothetical protein